MNGLRAIPGQSYEWIVLDTDDRIVATFHALTHSGGEAQQNAEAFAALPELIDVAETVWAQAVTCGQVTHSNASLLDAALAKVKGRG